jgi:methylmalonyl-CoA/ethylmalonyl-CoA epimerase
LDETNQCYHLINSWPFGGLYLQNFRIFPQLPDMKERVTGIHHINFLVRDLDQAEARYRRLLGLGPAIREGLPGRGVDTARFRIGQTWLVLVQPTSDDGEPARLLREQGEGFMLLSFAVDNLDEAMASATAAGARFSGGGERLGLAGWRIIDFDSADTTGALLQLTEAPRGS